MTPPEQTSTPRTDFVENGHNPVRAMPHLARDLERELTRANALAESNGVLAHDRGIECEGLRVSLQSLADDWAHRSTTNWENSEKIEDAEPKDAFGARCWSMAYKKCSEELLALLAQPATEPKA